MGAVDRAVAFTEERTVDARGKSQSRTLRNSSPAHVVGDGL